MPLEFGIKSSNATLYITSASWVGVLMVLLRVIVRNLLVLSFSVIVLPNLFFDFNDEDS